MTQNYLRLPKYSHLIKFSRRLSIDCGTILTKLITVENNTEKGINYRVFPTSELEINLKGLDEALHSAEEIYITGVGKFFAKSVVTSLVTATVVLVEEEEALAKGFTILWENVDESEVLYKVVTHLDEGDVPKIDENNPLIKKMMSKMNSTFGNIVVVEDEKIKRPSILMWSGATIKFYLLKEDGDIELIGRSTYAGETFRGLSKYLVDCNDYDKVTCLANSGRRANVDTQVKEIFSEDANSPYGKFPPELPIFSFGKCADHMLNKEDLKIEDIMASWSNLIYSDNLSIAVQLCQTYRVKSIYVGGALFMAPVFEKFNKIREKLRMSLVNVAILDCNYVLALGALLLTS